MRPAELDNIIMRTRVEVERQADAKSRAESLLAAGQTASDTHRGDTYGSMTIKGATKPQAKPEQNAAAGRSGASPTASRPPAHPSSNRSKGGKKGRHNEDDIDFSSDDDVSALNRGTEMLVIEDEFTVKAGPVSSTQKAAAHLPITRIPIVKNVNPLQRTPRGQMDAPTAAAPTRGQPQPALGAKQKKKKSSRVDDERFSSDDDDDVNKYMRIDDAPALPAVRHDIFCGRVMCS